MIRKLLLTLVILSCITVVMETARTLSSMNYLTISNYDRFYSEVIIEVADNVVDCLVHCSNRLSNCLCVIYRSITKQCSIIVATTTVSSNQPALSYLINDNEDKLYLSNDYDKILDKIRPRMIQQRWYGNVSFEKSWTEYEQGFGDIPNGDFWCGLSRIYDWTKNGPIRIRFEMWKHDGSMYWSEYSSFQIGSSTDKYRLHISGYNSSSTAGDSLTNNIYDPNSQQNQQQFSTTDSDNDLFGASCSNIYHGSSGFWYKSCGVASPNGWFSNSEIAGSNYITWYSLNMDKSLHRFRIYLYA